MNWGVLSAGPFGALWIKGLVDLGMPPEWVLTKPPRPAGRGYRERPTDVEACCSTLGLTVVRTSSPLESVQTLVGHGLDALFVVDCSFFIREPLLSLPKLGCLNLHPSLLPLLRGAAPIQRALWMGFTETGVTLFRLVEEMDAGPVLMQRRSPIDESDDMGTLMAKLAMLSAEMTVEFLRSPHSFIPVPQEGEPTYAPKISNEETRVDWRRGAFEILCMVRALSPRPGAWSTINGKRLKILKASIDHQVPRGLEPGDPYVKGKLPGVVCGDQLGLILLEVQPDGKRPMPGESWLSGLRSYDADCRWE
ncbi:methionyl-tRNA formyltransferase [Thermanaerovibrio velox DSM 12556]|uniref:methionyl-tRNA formyltransferase n=1 Tax=Thermanaerovibrio velox DSM 12556 TaxID=926567 RepID=H0URI4_9BACT|nr:methionyl-tRNA formyltransferase [Thermanaerovibrio velox]EHM09923.1 methionyl-tRNA formyltransferase [Thermanaerovibrio velox DSM 12556]